MCLLCFICNRRRALLLSFRLHEVGGQVALGDGTPCKHCKGGSDRHRIVKAYDELTDVLAYEHMLCYRHPLSPP